MAEAMLIPGATQVFADVLEGKNGEKGSGDVKTLFKNMEKGKYTLKDIVKVLESLDDRIDPAQLEKALQTPAAELRKLTTTWQRSLIELNKAGFFDVMVEGLKGMTKLVLQATTWIKENKEEIKLWADRIITTFKWLIDNLPLMISYFTLLKVSGWVLAMQTAAGAAGGLSAALTPLLLRILVIPAAIALATLAFIELYDTMQGQDTLMTRLSEQKDKGLLGYFAAITRTVGEFVRLMTSGLVTGAISMWGHLTGNAQLVEAAKATWAGSVTEFGDRQGKIWGDGRTEGTAPPQDKERVDMWGWLNGKDVGGNKAHVPYPNVLYPQASSKANAAPVNNYTTITSPITISVANGDPITIENTMNDVMNKWATKASANTSAFSLLKQ